MKKTSTEWLFEKLWDSPKDKLTWNAILEQAKEMEKQQIIETYIDASEKPALILDDAQQYYNETYGK